MEKIKKVIEAIQEMYEGIGEKPIFWYEEIGSRMYIYGIPSNLCQLFALIWCNAYDYSFYLNKDEDDEVFIEVLKLSED